MNDPRDIKIPDEGLSINSTVEGYSPREMDLFRSLINHRNGKAKRIALESLHQVERAMGIDDAPEAMWQAGFECYHVCYPHPFRDDRLVVDYYGDGRVAFFRMIGDEIDSSIVHIDNWYLTTLRKHIREFYPYKPVTSS